PRVSIVIVNWNGRNDTLECLESVSAIDYPNFNAIIVDNGSHDGSVEAIRGRFPEVTVLETGKNLGFAGGNNVGILYALGNCADYVLLLNNDTIVDPLLIKNFMEASAQTEHGGIYGAKIYYFTEPDRIWYAGGRWSDRKSQFIHEGYGCIDKEDEYSAMVETDYACGCALFIKAAIFNKIDLLDEQFFLTFEETDLCYRARRAGFKSYFVPGAKVWHKVSTSFGGAQSALYEYFMTRNKLLWAEKNLPLSKQLKVCRRVLRDIMKNMLPISNPILKARIYGLLDYLLRRFGNCSDSVRLLDNRR
ncbi:MAG: glycosyltransferase family 2 protein, partial [Nitrospirota bacterium]